MRHSACIALTSMLLGAAAAPASDCGPDLLYLVHDGDFENCSAMVVPGEPLTLQVVLASYSRPGTLSELRFRAENWLDPGDPAQGEIVENWTADSVEGDLATGIVLRWSGGLEGQGNFLIQYHDLGTIQILAYDESWIPEGYGVALRDVFFVDDLGVEREADNNDFEGGLFAFNWESSPCLLTIWEPPAGDNYCAIQRVFPPDGTIVAADFQFQARIQNWECMNMYPWGTDVQVTIDGELAFDGSGSGEWDFSVPISIAGLPDGSEIAVNVHMDFNCGIGCIWDLERTYIVDWIPVEQTSISTIKTRY